jgi:5-methylcytosine-specific restriction endonuclease McrA
MWHPTWAIKAGPEDTRATIDHITPLSLRGNDHYKNLRLLCYRCNQRKGSRMDKEKRHG